MSEAVEMPARPVPKTASERLAAIDLASLGPELRHATCVELARAHKCFAAAFEHERAIVKTTPDVVRRTLTRLADDARADGERIAATALRALGVE